MLLENSETIPIFLLPWRITVFAVSLPAAEALFLAEADIGVGEYLVEAFFVGGTMTFFELVIIEPGLNVLFGATGTALALPVILIFGSVFFFISLFSRLVARHTFS
jgi:hypothetical protein